MNAAQQTAPAPLYLVRRLSQATCGEGPELVKSYGPFAERYVADIVARNASEKHRGHLVEVLPVRGAR